MILTIKTKKEEVPKMRDYYGNGLTTLIEMLTIRILIEFLRVGTMTH